ncbi:MAG: hypothetical protein KZQ94_21270, partial [Candidatus Thiodiazotropha sp. (ex Troendleina suluensis)]|nr:hypothetical protein [Candidatus Thiodiazotropha sp. (ex Troendleina suluensis)]
CCSVINRHILSATVFYVKRRQPDLLSRLYLPGQSLTLQEIATLISERLVNLYRRDEQGYIPALRRDSPFQSDEAWSDLNLFYEYFHAETGQGLGAAHQTGWTGLLANLVMRRYRKDIPVFLGHEDESMAR